MDSDGIAVANLTFKNDVATEFTLQDLFSWVVWQFPKIVADKDLCAAVHPPIAEYGWLPATINLETEAVTVYGHVKRPFPTPETAAQSLFKK